MMVKNKLEAIKSIGALNEKLRAHDAGDLDCLAVRHRATFFVAGRGSVTGAGLDVGNFAHPIFGNGGDDGSRLADQLGHPPLAGTLRFTEHEVEQPNNQKGHQQSADKSSGGIDPHALGGWKRGQNHAKSAKGRHKTRQDSRTENTHARHTPGIRSAIRLAIRADHIVTAEEMTEESTGHGEHQAEDETNSIDNHKRAPS